MRWWWLWQSGGSNGICVTSLAGGSAVKLIQCPLLVQAGIWNLAMVPVIAHPLLLEEVNKACIGILRNVTIWGWEEVDGSEEKGRDRGGDTRLNEWVVVWDRQAMIQVIRETIGSSIIAFYRSWSSHANGGQKFNLHLSRGANWEDEALTRSKQWYYVRHRLWGMLW